MTFPSVFLASQSPRRQMLLAQIQVDFCVVAVTINEDPLPFESPEIYVQRMATEKARAGWQQIEQDTLRPVIGADTIVVLDNTIMGKPRDQEQARNMLHALSGRKHRVMTAVTVINAGQQQSVISDNTVQFASLREDEIAWYVSTQEGMDKAGAYAIQGQGALLVEQITGSYSGIMGLPLRETGQLLIRLSEEQAR